MGLIITNIRYDRDVEIRRQMADLLCRYIAAKFPILANWRDDPAHGHEVIKFAQYLKLGEQHEEERNEEGKEEREKGKVMAKHPGFAKVEKNIAKKEGVGKKAAGAILASASRKSSQAAKKKNPALKKVK